MKIRRMWLGALALLLIVSGSSAFATCQGETVLFEDTFTELLPSWGLPSDAFKVESKRLVIEPAPDVVFWKTNQASLYDNIDMCVAVTTITGVEPDNAYAGILFWYVDENNFYAFELSPNGKASVWRRQRGKWLEQVGWQEVEGARTGDNSINELRVVTRGDRATVYVNDTEFVKFTGSAPKEGQQIGFLAASPDIGSARYAFENLKITGP